LTIFSLDALTERCPVKPHINLRPVVTVLFFYDGYVCVFLALFPAHMLKYSVYIVILGIFLHVFNLIIASPRRDSKTFHQLFAVS